MNIVYRLGICGSFANALFFWGGLDMMLTRFIFGQAVGLTADLTLT